VGARQPSAHQANKAQWKAIAREHQKELMRNGLSGGKHSQLKKKYVLMGWLGNQSGVNTC
jgi:hypothetical protein